MKKKLLGTFVKHSQLFGLLSVLFLLVSLGLTSFVLQKQTQTYQFASGNTCASAGGCAGTSCSPSVNPYCLEPIPGSCAGSTQDFKVYRCTGTSFQFVYNQNGSQGTCNDACQGNGGPNPPPYPGDGQVPCGANGTGRCYKVGNCPSGTSSNGSGGVCGRYNNTSTGQSYECCGGSGVTSCASGKGTCQQLSNSCTFGVIQGNTDCQNNANGNKTCCSNTPPQQSSCNSSNQCVPNGGGKSCNVTSDCTSSGGGNANGKNCGGGGKGHCAPDSANCASVYPGTTSIYKDAGACLSQNNNQPGYQCCYPSSPPQQSHCNSQNQCVSNGTGKVCTTSTDCTSSGPPPPGDPCSGTASNTWVCGNSLPGGNPNLLYLCQNGANVNHQTKSCGTSGCTVCNGNNTPDECNPPSSACTGGTAKTYYYCQSVSNCASSSTCPSGKTCYTNDPTCGGHNCRTTACVPYNTCRSPNQANDNAVIDSCLKNVVGHCATWEYCTNGANNVAQCRPKGCNQGPGYCGPQDLSTCPNQVNNPIVPLLDPGECGIDSGLGPDICCPGSLPPPHPFSVALSTAMQLSVTGQSYGQNQPFNPNQRTAGFTAYFSNPNNTSTLLTSVNAGSHVLSAQIYALKGTLTYDPKSNAFIKNNIPITAIPPGVYQIILHVDGFTDAILLNSNGSTLFTLPSPGGVITQPVTLVAGDIAPLPHGDNFIDIQDYQTLLDCLNNVNCLNKTIADLNNDGVINQKDVDILISHFGSLGTSFSTQQFTCVVDPSCTTGTKALQLCPLRCSIVKNPNGT